MDRYYVSGGSGGATSYGWNTITTGATTGNVVSWNGVMPVAPVAAPPPTPLAWLESEVDRVCGMTRGGLAA